jgi:hypothetical protein
LQLQADLARVGGDSKRLVDTDGTAQALSMYHLQGVFMVYVLCLVFAVLGFGLEHALKKQRKNL